MTHCRITFVILVACLLVVVGCKSNPPGVSNRAGTIKTILATDTQTLTDAAEKVLEDMDLIIVSAEATSVDGRIIARTAQDVRIRIESKKLSEFVSEVSIRIGDFGDSELSLAILEEIKEELGLNEEGVEDHSGHDHSEGDAG